MVFWLWALLSLLGVIGVLLVAPSTIDGTILYQNHWGLLFTSMALMFAIMGLFVSRPNALFGRFKPILACLFLLISTLCFGFTTYHHYAKHTHIAHPVLNSAVPLVVKARVQIFELSDSVYDPALGLAYRQKAVLTDLRPDYPSANATPDNPFGFVGVVTQTNADVLPKSLTVLLHATPHRPNKTKPNDPLANLASLTVGDEMPMTLRLSPVLPDEEAGFDSHRWLLTRHIHAKADIISLDGLSNPIANLGLFERFLLKIEKIRAYYRLVFYDKFRQELNPSTAITLSLLTGDRALIDKPTKELYQYGGISHLLAISGTHVLFLAIVLANLMTWLANRRPSIYYYLPKWQLRFGIMALSAVLYAIFTGFEVPAVRTVLMLLVVGLVRWLLIRVSALTSLAVVALVMVIFDPFVVWQAGFWLSFVAVALLMTYEDKLNASNDLKQSFINLIKLQTYIFIAMLPISLLLFGKVSLLGLLINLFAVGLFGYVVVPLDLLAGILYPILPSLATNIWGLVLLVLDSLHHLMGVMALLIGRTWLHTPMPVAQVLVLGLVFWVWQSRLLPRVFALLPLTVAICAMTLPSGGVGNAVVALPLSIKNTQATLVKNGDDNWLILSSNLAKGQSANDEKLANELLDAVQKLGVRRLSGVLIQDDSMALARVAGRISLEMPVYRLWWAGGDLTIGKLTAQTCQAGQIIELADGQLKILTGWQMIDNKSMHTCNIVVDSHSPMMIDGKQETSVLINASRDDNVWQVYHLICANQAEQAILPSVVIGQSLSKTNTTD